MVANQAHFNGKVCHDGGLSEIQRWSERAGHRGVVRERSEEFSCDTRSLDNSYTIVQGTVAAEPTSAEK